MSRKHRHAPTESDLATQVRDAALSLGRRGPFRASDLRSLLDRAVSREYVTRILRRLVAERLLVKAGRTRGATYALAEAIESLRPTVRRRLQNRNVDEDGVLDSLSRAAPFIPHLPEHIRQIFAYAFTEMLNNAIEHSHSPTIDVAVWKDNGNLLFAVRDFGIGVFRNVMQQRGLASELEGIQDLLKGKTTTAPHAHSGEGIFFTSKVADEFILESFEYRLRIDNTIQDTFIDRPRRRRRGTHVLFRIGRNSKRRLEDVFRVYTEEAAEPAFDRSEVKVRLFAEGPYMSRSQARRLLAGLDRFRSVLLDFEGVTSVGQAFADEIFRVFARRHPHVAIEVKNMNEIVRFMIERARESGRGSGNSEP